LYSVFFLFDCIIIINLQVPLAGRVLTVRFQKPLPPRHVPHPPITFTRPSIVRRWRITRALIVCSRTAAHSRPE